MMLPWDTWSILLYCAVFLLSSVVWWRSYTSRRKQPPGPFNWPFVGCLPNLGISVYRSGKYLPAYFDSLTHRYGPVFRVNICGTNVIVLGDYNSINKAFQHPDLNDRPIPNHGLRDIIGGVGK